MVTSTAVAGDQVPYGITYDGTNGLVHLWYQTATNQSALEAFVPTSLATKYTMNIDQQDTTSSYEEALGGSGDGTLFLFGYNGGYQMRRVVAGPTSYGAPVAESGVPTPPHSWEATLVWDGVHLDVVEADGYQVTVAIRNGQDSYTAFTTVGSTSYGAFMVSYGNGDVAVFWMEPAGTTGSVVNGRERIAGTWGTTFVVQSYASEPPTSAGVSGMRTRGYVAPPPPPATFGYEPSLYAYSNDPVNLATGVFTAHADDLTLPGRLLPFAFTRFYNSADMRSGPLGPGWTHSYDWGVADGGSTLIVRRGDGRRDTFTSNGDGTYTDPPNVFDTLVKNADGTFTLTLTSQVVYEFSSAGLLTRIHEPAGNQVTLVYTSGDLTSITDTVGRQVTLTYDGSHRLTRLQDPIGRAVTYSYDASGRLVGVVDKIGNTAGEDPALHTWQYAYDGSSSHITTVTDPEGRVRVTNTYDSQGRVTDQRDGLGAPTTMVYGTLQTTLTDPRGHLTTYAFDDRMRVLSQSDNVGGTMYTLSYVYDAQGNRTAVTDRDGHTTDFTYDARGNVLTKTDPAVNGSRPVTTFTYNSKSDLTQIQDPLGFLTAMSYDPATNLLLGVSRQVDVSTFAATSYAYADPANPGLPTRIASPRGYDTALAYDARADFTSRSDADGATTTYAYDGVGRLVSFVDPDGNAAGGVPADHTWTIDYDPNDQEILRTDPLGRSVQYLYDAAGLRTGTTDRNGNLTFYAYDANARLATVQQKPDPFGQTTYLTSVERDANGNATKITQANGVVTDYGFDALDRLTSVTTHPAAGTDLTTSYVLAGNGQPTSRTTGDGVTVSYSYDALSRLSAVSGPSLSIAYAYDAVGRRTSMTGATGTTSYLYDGLGRVTQIAAPNGTLAYAYDLDGDRISLGYPGGDAVTYGYSPGGRLETVTDWAGRASSYTYRASGLVSQLRYPNGMTAAYTYDDAQRLTSVLNAVGASTVSRHTYTLDQEGNRTALDEFVSGITALSLSWGPSSQVNDVASGQQDRPAIAIGADAGSYLIWDDYRSGSNGDIYFSRRDPATGTWSANQKVNDDATSRTQWQAAIGVDASNNAYAVWSDQRDGNKTPDTNIYFSKRNGSTGTWGANARVNDDTHGSADQHNAAIAVAPNGAAVALWVDGRSNQLNVYSATLAPGASTWSANLRVTDNTSSRKFTPRVAVGADGTAYAVWEDDRSGNSDIWLATLPSGARAWTANEKISDDPGVADQYDPHIGGDASNDLIVAYLDDRDPTTEVRMTRRVAGSQSWEPSVVANDPAAVPAVLDLSVRSTGDAFAAWQDARGTSWDIWGADYDFGANSWSTSEMVSDDPGSSAQLRPTVALDATQVAVAWRDDRVSGGDIRARIRTTTPGTDHIAYTYDGLNRLVSVSGASAESFTYDAATNIAARTGPNATYAIDAANRVTSDGTRSFVWDGADRLIQRGSDTFAYDPLSRMTSSTVAGTLRTYAYDGDGLLASRTEGANTTAFLWDASNAPAPLLAAGSDRVVQGLGPLYVVHADGSTTTLARNGLGSVRAEVADDGSVAASFRYAAYGALAAASPSGATPNLLGYAGELADPSGLTYLRARWYDPGTGRFLTVDPQGGRAATPASFNPYQYSEADPIRYTDPTGRCGPWCILAGAAIGGVASVAAYAATTAATGEFDWGQAEIAFGAGAITGAVCAGTFVLACGVTSGAASSIQYLASPGVKSATGLVIATAAGAGFAVSPALRSVPWVKAPYAPQLAKRLTWWSRNAENIYRSLAINVPRSFVASFLSQLEGQVLGAESPK